MVLATKSRGGSTSGIALSKCSSRVTAAMRCGGTPVVILVTLDMPA
jgi:hypothetical protein